MSTKRQQLKSNIMSQVEVLVEEALSKGETRLTLTEIEEIVLSVRRQMEQELTGGLLAQQVNQTQSERVMCPDCGQVMQPKGKKKRDLRTRSGEVQLQRPYFYCAGCQRGSFPPG